MDKIILPTFVLEKYDSSLDSHKNYAEILENDKDYDEYMEPFWSLENSVNYHSKEGKYTAVYLAFIDSELIGMVGIIWVYDFPELVVSILPDKRGNHYSSVLLKEYTDYVFENYKEYTKLYAFVHDENTHSINNVKKAGFKFYNENLYVKGRY